MIVHVRVCPAVLSVIGPHAGETVDDIVGRKCSDIAKVGNTLWVYQSSKACVGDVQNFGKAYGNPVVYFFLGATRHTKQKADTGTKHKTKAKEMSADGKQWQLLPNGLGAVTGKLPGSGLVLASLTPVSNQKIDLWDFVEHPFSTPVVLGQGLSAVCAIAAPTGVKGIMVSNVRDVVAVGQLAPPFTVYLKP